MFKILLENLSARDKAKLIIGFPVIVVGTTLFSVTHYIKPLRKTMKDWWKVPFIAKGLIKKSTLTYTNGRQIKVDKNNLNRAIAISHFMALSNDTIKRCDIEASDDTVTATLMGRRFKLNLEYAAYIIGDISDREKLGYAKTVKGRKVLDIGAFVCDTTMFYAAAGAEHVYAFEPFTKLYLEGKRNISDNGFEKKVTLFNAGIAARPGSASLNESDEGGRRIDETENSGGMQIKLMTIEDMVNTYHINDGMMKIDIEGGEYKVFKELPSEVLRKFKYIDIDYHFGYKTLEERLRKEGFEVKRPKVVLRYNLLSYAGVMGIGNIQAERKD